MHRVGWAAISVTVAVTACSGATDAKAVNAHPPVTSSRSPMLPESPLPLRADNLLTGSPDRLVVAETAGTSMSSKPLPVLHLAAFDFRRWRWSPLPAARWTPVALPDGLVGVGLTCGADDDGNRNCQIELSTLRWGDSRWRHRQVLRRAGSVHETGGAALIGVRDGWAFFTVYRGRVEDERILKVNVAGRAKRLPPVNAWTEATASQRVQTCLTTRGIDAVTARNNPNRVRADGLDSVQYGPIIHLDDQARRPQWAPVAGTTPLNLPLGAGASGVRCGGSDLLLLNPPSTSIWNGHGFEIVTTTGTPTDSPSCIGPTGCIATPQNGFAFTDGSHLYRFRDDAWTNPVNTGPAVSQLGPIAAVGDLVVYQAVVPGSRELRVTQ